MAKIMEPILPIPSILGYWSIILGSFGGPGRDCFTLFAAAPSRQDGAETDLLGILLEGSFNVNQRLGRTRGPKDDHINIRILHAGYKAQYKGDARNHGL